MSFEGGRKSGLANGFFLVGIKTKPDDEGLVIFLSLGFLSGVGGRGVERMWVGGSY